MVLAGCSIGIVGEGCAGHEYRIDDIKNSMKILVKDRMKNRGRENEMRQEKHEKRQFSPRNCM